MINPQVFLFGTSGFLISLFIHILIWRELRPIRQLVWLIIIFIIFPVITYAAMLFVLRAVDGYNMLFIVLWHLLLSLAYIMTYPPIQAECPSLKIILAVWASMPKGLTFNSIVDIFPKNTLLFRPFDDLVNEGLIYRKEDKWLISISGRLLSVFFISYRKLLGLPPGEG